MPELGQLATVRVRAVGRLPKPATARLAFCGTETPRPIGTRRAFDLADERDREFPVYERSELAAGTRLPGPAVVEEGTSTTVYFGDQELSVNEFGDLLIRSTA